MGIAADPVKRLRDLQCAHADELRLLAARETVDDRYVEALLHRTLAEHKIRGEWFAPSPKLTAMIEEAKREPQPGSFEFMCAREPRLERLAQEARDFAEQSVVRSTVCRHFEFQRRFRPRLEALKGWGDFGGPIATRTEVEIAADAIQSLLPACRGCTHVLAGP